MRRLPILIGVAVVVVIVGLSSVFVVDERQQALVLQFGQVKQVRTEPGIGLKLPFIQDVNYYEGRILPLETQPLEVTPLDERRLVVDAFARWLIVDPVEFRQAVQTEVAAEQRLERILNASLREVLGSVPSADVLSPERSVLMSRIRDSARESAQGLGVEIIDVRIRRADLPEQNLNATFERMNAERQREAADERARGKERAQEIRATADRQAVELVSAAEREAAIIRGQADAERNRIYASAFGRDEEFFAFYRSLAAYEQALQGENSTMVISPDSSFFEYLKNPNPYGTVLRAQSLPGASAQPPAQVSVVPSAGSDGQSGGLTVRDIEAEVIPPEGAADQGAAATQGLRDQVRRLEAEVIRDGEAPGQDRSGVTEQVQRLEAEVVRPADGTGQVPQAPGQATGQAGTASGGAQQLEVEIVPPAGAGVPAQTGEVPTVTR